jgi:hypothetical protein
MKSVAAFEGWPALKHVTYTHSGGLVVAVVLGEGLGLYYAEPDAGEARRLTGSLDSEPAGSPVDDRIVFQRAGDLYLTSTGSAPLSCKGKSVANTIAGPDLCLLMPNAPMDAVDSDPTFSPDGESIAFLRNYPGQQTSLMTLDLSKTDPTSVQVVGEVSGAPSWGPR